MIEGLITTKDVLRHAAIIVRGYGLRRYFRCLCAVTSRRRTTFLELMWGR
jgi:hypothetical protein